METVCEIPADQLALNTRVHNNLVLQHRLVNPSPIPAAFEVPAEQPARDLPELASLCSTVRCAWRDRFTFRQECREDGKVVEGLRHPQMGALFAALAHWTVTQEPATIVMPTGSGKTETMIALLIQQRFERLLVVVPTAPLREQTAQKFLTLGVLKRAKVVSNEAPLPVVGVLQHRLKTAEEVAEFFASCNVVISTMQLVTAGTEDVQRAMARECSHLFIDEAHHVQAPTWKTFRRFFAGRPLLQFTATPFRSDGQHLEGEVIYNYPLRKAQQEGYFRPITFLPVREYDPERADEMIAQRAVGRLGDDRSEGLDHIVMARVASIERAKQVFSIYERLGSAYNPVLIHSEVGETSQREAFQALRKGTSRIVVCVNMLGEGFDLPELKIAALHDVHKSLAITLQFIGRFARTKPTIGDATVIANIEEAKVGDSLRRLYAEDADWNEVLKTLSEGATGREVAISDFLRGFDQVPSEISLLNISPKMSAVVYRTLPDGWNPSKVEEVISADRLCARPSVNDQERVALFVTHEREPVIWGDAKELQNVTWDLYLMHWDEERQLLFINSSNNDSLHKDLAEAVSGEEAAIIRGEQVYRSLHGVNRMVVMNLGLKHAYSRFMQFTMHAGSDIGQGLAQPYLANKSKSNIFVRGYEGGDRASVGCSGKGRIWSASAANSIADWVDWCRLIGTKLLDDSITDESILRHTMIPQKMMDRRPNLYPITIEWPEDLLLRSEEAIRFTVSGQSACLHEVDIALVDPVEQGPLRFKVYTATRSAEYGVEFKGERVNYLPTGESIVEIRTSRGTLSLSDWFQDEPPTIRFADGAYLEYNLLFQEHDPRRPAFEMSRIDVWDWSGTNIRKESQTHEKHEDSIQRRVLRELLREDHEPRYDIVFDDDDAGEAADVIAIAVVGDEIVVDLFHCKYSKDEDPGARVGDLYEVCGQAQRSAFWKTHFDELADHMRKRELDRRKLHPISRFERGDLHELGNLRRRALTLAPRFKASIVQPGLSRTKLEESETKNNQLELLAVTELYLQETYAVGFGVIASP